MNELIVNRTYNALIPLLLLVLKTFGKFLPKVNRSIVGRIGVMDRWRKNCQNLIPQQQIWFHVASVGELERIIPIIEYWNNLNPQWKYIVSFFSPEVLKYKKKHTVIEYIDFLPFDKRSDMIDLIDIIQPKLIIFDRYDIWPNLVFTASQKNIKIALINASTPPGGIFGQLSLAIRKPIFAKVNYWTFVDSTAARVWEPYISEGAKAMVVGNPRVDQAIRRAEIATIDSSLQKKLHQLWDFDPQKTLIAGSTWPDDEKLLLPALAKIFESGRSDYRMIIVPHEPSNDHVQQLIHMINNYRISWMRYSSPNLDKGQKSSAQILIFDIRGSLAELYAYGNTAYVGGGFGKEVHSIIEPAAHHKPIAFGPKFLRSPECHTLVLMEGACYFTHVENSVTDLMSWWIEVVENKSKRRKAEEGIQVFLTMNKTAANRIAKFLSKLI